MKKLQAMVLILGLSVSLPFMAQGHCGKCGTGDKAHAHAKQTVKYAVSGMTCGACEGKVSKSLAGVKGVTVNKVCSKSGCAEVTFDDSKVKKADVVKAINSTGFKVKGEILTLPVSGMTCGGCSGKVAGALKNLDGVSAQAVCHKSGKATVTFDSEKVAKDKIVATINGTGFKVNEK